MSDVHNKKGLPSHVIVTKEQTELLRLCSRTVEHAAFAAAQSDDMFAKLSHDRKVLDAVMTLTAAGYPAFSIASKAVSPRFDEIMVNRLLTRGLVIELLKPFLES